MKIKENYTYVTNLQRKIVDNECGKYTINSINLRCNEDNMGELKELCDKIDSEFLIYQYRKNEDGEYICSYRDVWDLFHWGDERSVRFSFNEKKLNKDKSLDVDRLIDLLSKTKTTVSIELQYGVELIESETIKNKAETIFKQNENKFINWEGKVGKIKKVNKEYKDSFYGYSCNYGFFKKGSRTKYYTITNAEIATM